MVPDAVWTTEWRLTHLRHLTQAREAWWHNLLRAYEQLEEIEASGPDDMCVEAARYLLGNVARSYILAVLREQEYRQHGETP